VNPLSQAMPGALVELLRGSPLSPGKVTFAWRAAVGPALERVTSARLEGRALVVEADSAQWAREVSRSAAVILTRVKTLLGADAVGSIQIQVRKP
jgi:predicted nucleic acid-binding Zn ribbon protein